MSGGDCSCEIKHFTSKQKLANEIIKKAKEIHRTDTEKTIAIIHRYVEQQLHHTNLKRVLDLEFNIIDIEKYRPKFDYNQKNKPIFYTDPYEIKGLEFDYVFLIHFDRKHYPSEQRIKELNDKYGQENFDDPNYNKDYDDILNDEKKVLYVACTRAKQELYIYYTGANYKRVSPFIRQFNTRDYDCNFPKSGYKK